MEGRRMAGSGHDFVITSSYLVGRRCDAAVPCATLGSCRSLGAAAALIRRRRVKTNVNEYVQRKPVNNSSSRLSCLGKRQQRASGRAAATIHRRAPIAEIADDVVLRSRAAAFSCQSVSGSCIGKAVRRPSFRRNRSTR